MECKLGAPCGKMDIMERAAMLSDLLALWYSCS